MRRVLHVLVSAFLWSSVLADGCPYKECFCTEDTIACNDLHLKAVPAKLGETNIFTRALKLDRNDITTIPARSLPGNLTEISLQGNPIETIDDAAFDESINTLQTLSFSQARFTQIPEAVLRLNALKSLSIYDTNILEWSVEATKQLSSAMETLILDSVGFTTWPHWIHSYTLLKELTISGSSISSLPDDALDLVTNTLILLALNNNSLTAVPKALSKLTALKLLMLENNIISDITWLPQKATLNILSLHNNRISDTRQLTNGLHPYAHTLYSFDIHDNYLPSIPNLEYLTQITGLDYTNNHISDPYSGSVPPALLDLGLENNLLPVIPPIMLSLDSVPILNLKYNRIVAIEGEHFPSSTTGVDLGYNLITELTDTSFPVNSNITSLLFNYNPISIISPHAFQNVPLLGKLNLQNSRLTRLPLAIASLTNLGIINVSGSTSLVCTCMEKSLEPRIKSMMPEFVVGDCGHTSVYIFFTQLSPGCPPLP